MASHLSAVTSPASADISVIPTLPRFNPQSILTNKARKVGNIAIAVIAASGLAFLTTGILVATGVLTLSTLTVVTGGALPIAIAFGACLVSILYANRISRDANQFRHLSASLNIRHLSAPLNNLFLCCGKKDDVLVGVNAVVECAGRDGKIHTIRSSCEGEVIEEGGVKPLAIGDLSGRQKEDLIKYGHGRQFPSVGTATPTNCLKDLVDRLCPFTLIINDKEFDLRQLHTLHEKSKGDEFRAFYDSLLTALGGGDTAQKKLIRIFSAVNSVEAGQIYGLSYSALGEAVGDISVGNSIQCGVIRVEADGMTVEEQRQMVFKAGVDNPFYLYNYVKTQYRFGHDWADAASKTVEDAKSTLVLADQSYYDSFQSVIPAWTARFSEIDSEHRKPAQKDSSIASEIDGSPRSAASAASGSDESPRSAESLE